MRGKWSHSQRNGGKALLERGYLWGKEKGGGKEMTFDDQRDILHFVLILLVTQVHAHKVTKHEGVLWIRGKEPHNTKASTDTIKEYKVGGYLRDIAHVEPRDVTTYKQTCKTHTYSLSIPPSFLLSWTRFVEFLTSRSSTFSGSGFIALHHSQRETELKQPYRTIPYRTVQDLRTQDSGLRTSITFRLRGTPHLHLGEKPATCPQELEHPNYLSRRCPLLFPLSFEYQQHRTLRISPPPPIKNKRLF